MASGNEINRMALDNKQIFEEWQKFIDESRLFDTKRYNCINIIHQFIDFCIGHVDFCMASVYEIDKTEFRNKKQLAVLCQKWRRRKLIDKERKFNNERYDNKLRLKNKETWNGCLQKYKTWRGEDCKGTRFEYIIENQIPMERNSGFYEYEEVRGIERSIEIKRSLSESEMDRSRIIKSSITVNWEALWTEYPTVKEKRDQLFREINENKIKRPKAAEILEEMLKKWGIEEKLEKEYKRTGIRSINGITKELLRKDLYRIY